MNAPDLARQPLRRPGVSAGLIDVLRWRFLLKLLVRKELRVRYRGSILGMLWSYVKPGVQLIVFYIALGKFLRFGDTIPNYIIYLFAGIVIINFFTEVFGNATRAIVVNADLVKKIFMPRELFPVASVWVAIYHLLPQLLVLIIACLFSGWQPGIENIAALFGALAITMATGLGLGLIFGAVNVLFRDAENFVDLILMMATWLSPVLYTWFKVWEFSKGGWLYTLYQCNPLTVAVELCHHAFWAPTAAVIAAPHKDPVIPHGLGMWSLAALGISAVLVFVGQLVFRRLEYRFAQEL